MAKRERDAAAPAAQTEAALASAGAGVSLRVAARTDGFRRCGRAWPAAGIVVAGLAEDMADRLRAEPELVVTEVP